MVGQYNNPPLGLRLGDRTDLPIQPLKITHMSLAVCMHVPILDVIEAVETKSDILQLIIEDMGVQRAAQDRDMVVDIVARLIQENNLPYSFSVLPALDHYLSKSTDPTFHPGPAAMVGFVVAGRKKTISDLVSCAARKSVRPWLRGHQCRRVERDREPERGSHRCRTLQEPLDGDQTVFETVLPWIWPFVQAVESAASSCKL